MSEMDCEDYESDASDDDEEYEGFDDCFDEPTVAKKDKPFQVLDETTCHALATKAVVDVSEILCCEIDVSQSLLRYYKWDRERLTEGTDSQSFAIFCILICFDSAREFPLFLRITELRSSPN